MTKHDLIFFEKRSTPKVITQGMRFDAPESYGKQTKRRPATEAEEKVIARGDWVRVDEKGHKGREPGYKKTRMPGREHLVHGDDVFNRFPEEVWTSMSDDAEKLERIKAIVDHNRSDFGLSANALKDIFQIIHEPTITRILIDGEGYGTISVNGKLCAVVPYPDAREESLVRISEGKLKAEQLGLR